MIRFNTALVTLLSLTLLFSAGCGNGKTKSATPEEAFENLKKAGVEKDAKKLVSVLSPNSVDQMATAMAMFCGMANKSLEAANTMGEAAKPDDDQIASAKKAVAAANKHGITDEMLNTISPFSKPDSPDMKKIVEKISNKSAFCASMMDIIDETVGDSGSVFQGLADATITDVKIDGDSATGTATINGNQQTYEFRKINGTWLVEMPGR